MEDVLGIFGAAKKLGVRFDTRVKAWPRRQQRPLTGRRNAIQQVLAAVLPLLALVSCGILSLLL